MASTWCLVCCTNHPPQGQCPGVLRPSGPEREGWKTTVETPLGMQAYGVMLTPVGRRWRARILTYPNILWTIPGGGGTMKFLGRTAEEAERKAVMFIREHCGERAYLVRDELEPADSEPVAAEAAGLPKGKRRPAAPRFRRTLSVRFGQNIPTEAATTANLSEQGMFVSTVQPLAPGLLVGLMLQLEHCTVPLRGSVVWQRRRPRPGLPPGMGLQLLNPPDVYVRYIHALEPRRPAPTVAGT